MDVRVYRSAEEASSAAAAHIAALVARKHEAVLGLATGDTPLLLYRQLIALVRSGGLDLSRTTTFNLDEYVGLSGDDPRSYGHYMRTNLFDPVGIDLARTHVPDGLAPDVEAECEAYEHAIAAAGGIDLQVLGIGADGHVGFNEPTSSLGSRTRIKTLTRRTRADNARFFESPDDVPLHVLTMGIGTILDSREVLLLAFGDGKADAVARTIEGPVGAIVPASALQLHRNVRVLLDDGAASRLALRAYYDEVAANLPP